MCGKQLTILFMVKSLKSFDWNNVGPVSQTVDQHYFTIGPMYRAIRVVAFRGIKRSEQTRDYQSILFQCWASVVNTGPTLSRYWYCVYQVHHIDCHIQ